MASLWRVLMVVSACVTVAVLLGLFVQPEKASDVPTGPVILDVSKAPALVIGPTRVKVVEVVAAESARPQESKLRIKLEVENVSQKAKFYFSGWDNPFVGASLQDDLGNRYHSQGGLGKDREGYRGGSLYPGDKVQDTLDFEFPVSAAKSLTLTLPGSDISQQQDIRFRIPKALWTTP
jgi:hypothetical protein